LKKVNSSITKYVTKFEQNASLLNQIAKISESNQYQITHYLKRIAQSSNQITDAIQITTAHNCHKVVVSTAQVYFCSGLVPLRRPLSRVIKM